MREREPGELVRSVSAAVEVAVLLLLFLGELAHPLTKISCDGEFAVADHHAVLGQLERGEKPQRDVAQIALVAEASRGQVCQKFHDREIEAVPVARRGAVRLAETEQEAEQVLHAPVGRVGGAHDLQRRPEFDGALAVGRRRDDRECGRGSCPAGLGVCVHDDSYEVRRASPGRLLRWAAAATAAGRQVIRPDRLATVTARSCCGACVRLPSG